MFEGPLRQGSPCPESLTSISVLTMVLMGQHYVSETLEHGTQECLPRGVRATLKITTFMGFSENETIHF